MSRRGDFSWYFVSHDPCFSATAGFRKLSALFRYSVEYFGRNIAIIEREQNTISILNCHIFDNYRHSIFDVLGIYLFAVLFIKVSQK